MADAPSNRPTLVEINCLVCKEGMELSKSQRDLFYVTYRSWLDEKKEQLKELRLEKNQGKGNELQQEIVLYIENLVDCILEDFLIEDATHTEDLIFYWKMDGEFRRELSQFQEPGECQRTIDTALQSFENATRWIQSDTLERHHPLKLELAVSFADFCHDVLDDRKRAVDIVQTALDDDHSVELHTVDKETSDTKNRNWNLLRDRLALWPGELLVEQEETE